MKSVRPKPIPTEQDQLTMTPEERFVFARIDGRLSLDDLAALTGLEEKRVNQIVTSLASRGAVALEPEVDERSSEDAATLADFAAVLGMDPTAFTPPEAERAEPRSNYPPPDGAEANVSEVIPAAPPLPILELEEVVDEEPDAAAPVADEAEEPADSPEQEADRATAERNYRQVYETRWRALTVDQRVDYARKVSGPDLFAFCFDPDPRVVAGILENHLVGLDHVRMLAFHHRTSTGLEIVARRSDWLRDQLVERRLLRNPMIGEAVLARIMGPKQVLQTYKICIDREIPELTRAKSRGHLRQKWQKAPPEDRSELLLRTEGRCLILMTGCTFDAKTTQILCGRPINSMLFIQNLAKFAATPPSLLAHLMKQPFVRKNAPIKKLLLSHPNMPGDVKRQY